MDFNNTPRENDTALSFRCNINMTFFLPSRRRLEIGVHVFYQKEHSVEKANKKEQYGAFRMMGILLIFLNALEMLNL